VVRRGTPPAQVRSVVPSSSIAVSCWDRNYIVRIHTAMSAAESVIILSKHIIVMQLEIWLPAMFVLGLVSMGGCFLFMKACEEI
jgi:hypothetical protein